MDTAIAKNLLSRRQFVSSSLLAIPAMTAKPSLAAGVDMPDGIEVVASDLAFPEGLFLYPDGTLGCVEIASGALLRIAKGETQLIGKAGPGPNGAMMAPDGRVIVTENGGLTFARKDGIYRITGIPHDDVTGSIVTIDPASGSTQTLYASGKDKRLNGPNDLLLDPVEGFWFTDTGKNRAAGRDKGVLYWAALDGSRIISVLDDLDSPNGLTIDPERQHLYIALSAPKRILRARIDGPATLSQVQVLPSLPGDLLLDNIVCDTRGMIIAGCVKMGGIMSISPQGRAMAFLPLPDFAATALTFGGDDMQTLYVALSTTGRIVSLRWPVRGINRRTAGPA